MADLDALHELGVLSGATYPKARIDALATLSLSPALLAICDRVARFVPGLDAHARDRVALLLLLVKLNEARGSTALVLDSDGTKKLLGELGEPEADLRDLITDPRLEAIVGAEKPLLRTEGGFASNRAAASEKRIASMLLALAAREVARLLHADALYEVPFPLNGEQRRAVARATSSALTIVTGGPGTGKTSIVSAILRAAVEGGLPVDRIALAAPTGKAAQRMGEALRAALARSSDRSLDAVFDALPAPATLHRLLGYHPERDRFRFHADDPLEAELVVVDEASMLDLTLVRGLLDAISPTARLVLLGDADQLPSVGSGAVLRDVVSSLPECTVRLVHSHRMDERDPAGRHVLLTARRILGADTEARADSLFDGEAGIPCLSRSVALAHEGVELLEGPAESLEPLLSSLARSLATPVPEGSPFTPLERRDGEISPHDVTRALALLARLDVRRVLAPVNDGEPLRSVNGVNAHCHAIARRVARNDHAFLVGEPVMVTRNDYALGLWNGDQGLVMFVARDGASPRPEVVFPRAGSVLTFPLETVEERLTHAYALSVHKSQGSEYDAVLLVLPTEPHPLVTREVLYTAITRARRSVVIAAPRHIVTRGAQASIDRQTSLGRLLGR